MLGALVEGHLKEFGIAHGCILVLGSTPRTLR